MEFNAYLRDEAQDINWYDHWVECRTKMENHVTYCRAIEPIEDDLSSSCLCQLKDDCDNLCDDRVDSLYVEKTNSFLGATVDYDYATHQDCQDIVDSINADTTLASLCAHSDRYQLIVDCGL